MKTCKFDYELPKRFIAQKPVAPRDASKLMVFDSVSGEVFHDVFRNIGDYLRDDDVLVVNKSKVIPARVLFDNGRKEVFILRKRGCGTYLCMVRPGRFFSIGKEFEVDGVNGEVLEVLSDGTRVIKFDGNILKKGQVPTPPYVKNKNIRFEQYQTVYANDEGSVAAPTAGFHFTNRLIEKLKGRGIGMEKVVLHVGRGTFLPVSAENVEDHEMHSEFYELSEGAAERLGAAKSLGRRIVAVGTTSVRVLESCYRGGFKAGAGETDIFIYPGYRWKVVDALITNFHLPKSTLIMLVASFLENKGVKDGVSKILELYGVAKDKGYRFYSFGDAMLIY